MFNPMKRTIRKKYVPCTMRVLKFNVERGFAEGSFQNPVGSLTKIWNMQKSKNGHFQNEQYQSTTKDEVGQWNDVLNNKQ